MTKDQDWLKQVEDHIHGDDCKCFVEDQDQFWMESENQIIEESEARIKLLLAKQIKKQLSKEQ